MRDLQPVETVFLLRELSHECEILERLIGTSNTKKNLKFQYP